MHIASTTPLVCACVCMCYAHNCKRVCALEAKGSCWQSPLPLPALFLWEGISPRTVAHTVLARQKIRKSLWILSLTPWTLRFQITTEPCLSWSTDAGIQTLVPMFEHQAGVTTELSLQSTSWFLNFLIELDQSMGRESYRLSTHNLKIPNLKPFQNLKHFSSVLTLQSVSGFRAFWILDIGLGMLYWETYVNIPKYKKSLRPK